MSDDIEGRVGSSLSERVKSAGSRPSRPGSGRSEVAWGGAAVEEVEEECAKQEEDEVLIKGEADIPKV